MYYKFKKKWVFDSQVKCSIAEMSAASSILILENAFLQTNVPRMVGNNNRSNQKE